MPSIWYANREFRRSHSPSRSLRAAPHRNVACVKIGSPLPHKKARIEIIPLIDIMFFLLASFLLASLSMMRLQSIKVNLPEAVTAKRDFQPDVVNIAVKANGEIYYEKQKVDLAALQKIVADSFR